jgi:cytochrome P450
MATTDPPRHTQLRNLVEQVLTGARVAQLEPRIRDTVQGLLAAFGTSGEVEFVGAFAASLTTGRIGYLFGIPAADYRQLRDWLSAALYTTEGPPTARRVGHGHRTADALTISGR